MSETGQPTIGVGWTGASGLVYGVRLVDVLLQAGRGVDLVISDAVLQTAPVEMQTGRNDQEASESTNVRRRPPR